MSKIAVELRVTNIQRRAAVECNILRNEGYDVPRAFWRKVPLFEMMTRTELRQAILEGLQNEEEETE